MDGQVGRRKGVGSLFRIQTSSPLSRNPPQKDSRPLLFAFVHPIFGARKVECPLFLSAVGASAGILAGIHFLGRKAADHGSGPQLARLRSPRSRDWPGV
jgi:hypothetical protein